MSTASNGLQGSDRKQRILISLTEMLAKLFGKSAAELDTRVPMIDLGADSLFLLQTSNAIREKFKVKIPFRLLLEELSTIENLAAHLDHKMSPDSSAVLAEPANPAAAPQISQPAIVRKACVAALPVVQQEPEQFLHSAISKQVASLDEIKNAVSENDPIYQIFSQQLALMSQQIAILTGQPAFIVPDGQTDEKSAISSTHTVPPQQPATKPELPVAEGTSAHGSKVGASAQIEPEVYVPYETIQAEATKSLSENQRKHLADLIGRINKRTGGSKRITQEYRKYHADNRTAAGFRMPWKEMFYPLVVERGQGSRIWDMDGNEYIDMTMGFGALLFGHSPAFVIEALKKQLDFGIRLGPHSREAGEAAKLICEMTGVERVAFCNSGTEAVMTALRLARTVTGRSRIALFEGCYHGTFDGVLVKGERRDDGIVRAVPLAPGIPQHMIENVLLLKYDDPQSLTILESQASELAAVLIEPPRSRRPDVQPKEFLLKLRNITESSGSALIFDEVVTGFRFHSGGAQALFGIHADLVTYGKALGAGLPVGVVAGKAKFMDAVDGGMWQYGDGSYPESDITFFTGTYFKHPLLMPAIVAVLQHIKQSGPQLQESLNAKAKYVADELSAFFEARGFPLRVAQLGSLFRILHGPESRYMDLFYYHLLDKGVYVCETHNFLVSTAHSDSDMEAVVRAAKESVLELHEGGFLPAASSHTTNVANSSQLGTNAAPVLTQHDAIVRAPLTEAQRQIWAVAHMGEGDSRAYNLPMMVQWKGDLDLARFCNAVNRVVQRHEAFRATFSPDGDFQIISPLKLEIPFTDLSGLAPQEQQAEVSRWRKAEATQQFDFITGPLLSLRLLKLQADLHLLLVTMHHIISDGWSMGAFIIELQELYWAELTGEKPQLPEPRSFAEYAKTKAAKEKELVNSEAEVFWMNEFPNSLIPQRLPADGAAQEDAGIIGMQKRMIIPASFVEGLKEVGRRYSGTRFMVLLAICKIFIYYLTKQEEVVIGVPSAGQNLPDAGYVVGCCVNLLAFRTQLSTDLTFPQLVVMLRQKLVKAYEHQDYPFNRLLKRLRTLHPHRPEPAISVIFNLDRVQPKKKQKIFDLEVIPNHNETAKFDLTIDVTDTPDSLVIDFEYKSILFSGQRITSWMALFHKLIQEISLHPAQTIREYFSALQEEEGRQGAIATQELKRQELQRFAASKRKSVAS